MGDLLRRLAYAAMGDYGPREWEASQARIRLLESQVAELQQAVAVPAGFHGKHTGPSLPPERVLELVRQTRRGKA